MNQRERLLVIAVCGLLAVIVGLWIFRTADSALSSRRSQVTKLRLQLTDQEDQIAVGQLAVKRLGEMESKALPADNEKARALYQAWLLARIEAVGIEGVNVTAVVGREREGVFFQHPFNVTGRGNLSELVDFMHQFYSANFLHRIERMTVKPIKDSQDLQITLVVEAVSMPNSANVDALPTGVSTRLGGAKLDDYRDPILRRNLFGAPNKPPRLAGLDRSNVYVNREASLSVRASDPDRNDRLTFQFVANPSIKARFDERRGRIQFTPTELGKFDVTVTVSDDGLPSKTDTRTYTISVVEEPVEKPREPAPVFNSAKFAFVTGVVEVNGIAQVWVHDRTNGKLHKLGVGQDVEIGLFRGKVSRIMPRAVEFSTADKKLVVVRNGQSLTDGAVLPVDDI